MNIEPGKTAGGGGELNPNPTLKWLIEGNFSSRWEEATLALPRPSPSGEGEFSADLQRPWRARLREALNPPL